MNHKSDIVKTMEMLTQKDLAVAFSGGADSSLLLQLATQAAKKTGVKVYAMHIKTTLHPAGDAEVAKQVAEELGGIYEEIRVDEFANAGIENNPVDRCYRCKYYMFSQLKERAAQRGIDTIIDGTNADDLKVYRPGIKALKELEITSPLAECGLTKEEVRKLAEEHGISVANRPAAPCLATRFPYGTLLTKEALEKVDRAENYLRDLGGYNVRVRVHDRIARIEIDRTDEEVIMIRRDEIVRTFKEMGYDYITLDLEGFRSGSMDIGLTKS